MNLQKEDILLRKLEPADAAWLSALAAQAYSDHYADTWYDGGAWYIHHFLSTERLLQELEDTNALFYAVYYKDAAVGSVKLNLDRPLHEEPNALELERIYLIKSASGKGIGTLVVESLIEQARKENKKVIWLKAMDTNPGAVRFYTKMGFEICGTHQVDFEQKKEGMRGMYVMRKLL